MNVPREFTAMVERDPGTGFDVASVPGFAGAHPQGEILDELQANLAEVIERLLEDGEPRLDAELVGTQRVRIG
jgi:predicted RNase H-like HicB family nuclease